MSRIAVVIPASGSGRRMGGVFKPFMELSGIPMLQRTIQPFLQRGDVKWIVVALPAEIAAAPPHWLLRDPRIDIVAGGSERTESVRNALRAVPAEADVVLVHDAARPLITADVIERCIAAALDGSSVIAAVPVVDTIKDVADDGFISGTPDRNRLWSAQTPQAFPADVLRAAHARGYDENTPPTDDAALVERCGTSVRVVRGAPENIKVTTPADVLIAEALLGALP